MVPYHGFQHELPPQNPAGIQQNGDIGEKIQNSRNIIVPEAETAPDLQQRADQLAHTHAAAGVKPQRNNEVVQGKRRDQLAQNTGQHPKSRTVHCGVEHPIPLLSCRQIKIASAVVGFIIQPIRPNRKTSPRIFTGCSAGSGKACPLPGSASGKRWSGSD